MDDVTKETRKLDALKAAMESDLDMDDPETVFALMEGQTNLVEAVEVVLNRIDEADILLKGLERKIAELETRKSTLMSATERRRNLILMAIERMPLDDKGKRAPLRLPTATLSPRPTPPSLVVEDESAVPSSWFKRGDPKLDKRGIKNALSEAMEPVRALEKEIDREPNAEKRGALIQRVTELRGKVSEQFPGVTLSDGGVTLSIRRH